MATKDPRPADKRRKAWSQLSAGYKQKLLFEAGKVNWQKPKGKRGKVAVARLGRTKKSGMFQKIAKRAAKRYGSIERGKKVAGAIYWQKVRGG